MILDFYKNNLPEALTNQELDQALPRRDSSKIYKKLVKRLEAEGRRK